MPQTPSKALLAPQPELLNIPLNEESCALIMAAYPEPPAIAESNRRLADLHAICDIKDDTDRVLAVELSMAVAKDVPAIKDHYRPFVRLNQERLRVEGNYVKPREEQSERVKRLVAVYDRQKRDAMERERQRLRQEQLAREAEEKRQLEAKAQEEALALEQAGKPEEAAAVIETAQQIIEEQAAAPRLEVIPPPPVIQRAAGERIKRTPVYDMEITDPRAALLEIADNPTMLALCAGIFPEIVKGLKPLVKQQGPAFERSWCKIIERI